MVWGGWEGVPPDSGGVGGKGVMRNRAREKEKGTLDTDKEPKYEGSVGVRAPWKPLEGNTHTQQDEEELYDRRGRQELTG